MNVRESLAITMRGAITLRDLSYVLAKVVMMGTENNAKVFIPLSMLVKFEFYCVSFLSRCIFNVFV